MANHHRSYRNESRLDYGKTLDENEGMCREQLTLGGILRIADAVEVMAQNHGRLIEERDRYKQWYENEIKFSRKLVHRIAGLQGYIKRIKRRG